MININTDGTTATEQFGFCTKLPTKTVSYNWINEDLADFNNKSKAGGFLTHRKPSIT